VREVPTQADAAQHGSELPPYSAGLVFAAVFLAMPSGRSPQY